MPVRDGATFLAEAVDSVRAQTFEDLELIVVDDGSTDRTPEILADYPCRDERIRVVRQTGGGVSRARNRGSRDARGKYLACLDADDAALPERLALQVAFLEANPDVAVVGGGGIMIDERGVGFGVASYPDEPAAVARYLDTGRAPLIHSAATMRREAFRATSGYRAIVDGVEDIDLWLRIGSHGLITNLREPVVRYRLHANQASTKDVARAATAVAAARGAARARANGERDPLDAAEQLDAALLERLGVHPEDVAAQEVDNGLWLARTLTKAGHHTRAVPLWSLCATRAAATADPRATRARVLRARADACGWRRQKVRAAGLRAMAGVLQPRAAAARLRRLVPRRASQS
jgi:hypothetical protein